MIYVYAINDFTYHKMYFTKRKGLTSKDYHLMQGQLLTVCEAVQNLDMTIDEILNLNDILFIQLNRRNTVKDEDNRRFMVEGCENYRIAE